MTESTGITKEPPRRKARNRQAEDKAALERKVAALAQIREARDLDQPFSEEIMQVAQALVLCGLPYEPTDATRIVRRARLADGSEVVVVFSAVSTAAMPYGSDRSVLHFILDRAVKSRSRFISWKTAKEFLTAMKMNVDSGKNCTDLRARFERIRGLTIYVQRTRGAVDGSATMPVIRRSKLPTSVDRKSEETGHNLLPFPEDFVYGVEIGPDFFDELMKYHVPVPAIIIQQTRKKSQLQDCMLFLHWRCYAAQSETTIPWEALRQQLWQDDSNKNRIRQRFKAAIKEMKVFWPELQAEARKDGLWLAPPINGRYLIPRGTGTRRLPAVSMSDPAEVRIVEHSVQ